MSCRIKVDMDLCQGHGVCKAEAPQLFDVADGDGPYPQVKVLSGRVAEQDIASARAAAEGCPNQVITIIEDQP